MDVRHSLLNQWGDYVGRAITEGRFTKGPCPVRRIEGIAGPRAGALELYIGLEAGNVMRALARDDCASLRQFVPWDFTGQPQVYMHGRGLRLEAGWPSSLAETLIKLTDLCKKPERNGRWIAGKNERGATIVPGLSDQIPHYLISGQTGSGKSVAMQSAVLQLSADPANQILLLDGKGGESLAALENLPGCLGPCAVEADDIRNALGYACKAMHQRSGGNGRGRIIICFDEFQEFAKDKVIMDLLRKLAAQGRSRKVHLLCATQHPVVSAFGDPGTRRNLVGKLALRVSDIEASRVAVGGGFPRADHLLGAGDAYLVAPGSCHRTQLVYVDNTDIAAATNGGGQWRFDRWPELDGGDIGNELPEYGQFVYTGTELGVAIVSAVEGEGRDLFSRRMDRAGFGTPGYNRQRQLRELGAGAHDELTRSGYFIAKQAPGQATGTLIPAVSVW